MLQLQRSGSCSLVQVPFFLVFIFSLAYGQLLDPLTWAVSGCGKALPSRSSCVSVPLFLHDSKCMLLLFLRDTSLSNFIFVEDKSLGPNLIFSLPTSDFLLTQNWGKRTGWHQVVLVALSCASRAQSEQMVGWVGWPFGLPWAPRFRCGRRRPQSRSWLLT